MKILGKLLILAGLILLLLIFTKPVCDELVFRFNDLLGVEYQLSDNEIQTTETNRQKIISPVDLGFGIVIPKINANAKIIAEVDPLNPNEYLPALKHGVAQAKGTYYPGQGKKIYLFAHSADAFYNVGRYNAVFYLIGKLIKGDEIDIFYRQSLYRYRVEEVKVVSPDAIDYLDPGNSEILVLQTCYPPGTTLKRLIVTARPI